MNQFLQILGLVTGWLLVGWVAAQAILVAVKTVARRARNKRRYESELADFRQLVDAAAQAARASKAIAAWNGWRPFRVAAVVDEAIDVKSFYLTPEDRRPLSPFAPGQFLTFRLPLAGSETQLVRCYSLSDRPRQDYYRVSIKRIGPPTDQPDSPPGRGSSYFHQRVHVGDVLDVRAPAGTFLIDPRAAEPIVLIGAGIGVTPLISMLEAIVQSGQKREVHVLFGFRHGREHPFKERLATICAEHPHIHTYVSYSRPTEQDVLHRDYTHRGRISLERVRDVLPSNNYRFYLCGPGALMESLVPALWDWGVPESHVHFEAFGPASVRSASPAGKTVEPCEVRFERSSKTVTWDNSLASILEFGEAAGVAMPSGCRAGSCGECMMAIRSGTVATVKPPGIPVAPGHCLTCISVPASELVLDA